MEQAERPLRTASFIQELSTDDRVKQALKVERGFESYIWVIVISYYSMFYAALAMLARDGVK
jgi:uncharacterized protein (UPF0332 family)